MQPKREVCEQLFNEHRQGLVEAAQRLMTCRALAEDVVQEVFLKFWQAVDADELDDPLRYLYRMVRNQSIDRLRRNNLESRFCIEESQVEDVPVSIDCPVRLTQGQLDWQRLLAALHELPERSRQVFTRCQVEGLTQREVAEQLNASPTLVNFLLRDALNHCRARLEPEQL